MDKKKLRELINLFKESGLAKMEITENSAEENYSLKLESGAAAPAYMPAPLPYMQPVQEEKSADEPAEAEIKDYNKYRDIKSPMVGIFYAAPSPEAEPFVKVGSKVKKGDTLFIIESMKLMNEVPSDVDGIVTQILVDNAQPVEYGQPILVIE